MSLTRCKLAVIVNESLQPILKVDVNLLALQSKNVNIKIKGAIVCHGLMGEGPGSNNSNSWSYHDNSNIIHVFAQ